MAAKNGVGRACSGLAGRVFMAGAIAALGIAFAPLMARAQCVGYTIAPGPAVFIAGIDDTLNHCDDCTTAITLPFGVSFNGTVFNVARVSSNGVLEFVANNGQFGNVCLPVVGFGASIFAFWDDQRTDLTPDSGIFTTTVGASPNRTFVIEWRTHYFADAATTFLNDYELLLYEGGNNFDVVYGTPMSDRSSATIGQQAADAGPSTQFVCNMPGPVSGDSLRFSCVSSASAGACCVATAAGCVFTDAPGCSGQNGTFRGVGTVCATANCPTPGACCASGSGACTLTLPAACAAPNSFRGVGTACTPTNACAGACCNTTSGACAASPAAGCVATATYQGVGSGCAPNPCGQGACCNQSSGICTLTTTTGCVSPGVFQSAGTICNPNPCPQPPTGACCLPTTQTCSEVFGSACATQGGAYQGNNTTCATSACPFGACCAGCLGCFISTSADCTGQQGTFHGNGSACDTQGCTIINAGFESGTFAPGWTQFGDQSFTGVFGPAASPGTALLPHGGGRGADFGPTVTTGGIQQTIPALAGNTVTIGFWYAAAGNNNSFDCTFDGTSLVSFTNDTAHTAWTQFTFPGIVVSASNPELVFTFFNPPSWDNLDDVTVCISSGVVGVCCRGATCNGAITSGAACAATLIAGQNAGSAFPTGGACNSAGSYTSPCCYANYNKLNGITVQDIFDYLQDWFAGSPYAATGSNGTVGLTVQHIFDYLTAWFNGGCS